MGVLFEDFASFRLFVLDFFFFGLERASVLPPFMAFSRLLSHYREAQPLTSCLLVFPSVFWGRPVLSNVTAVPYFLHSTDIVKTKEIYLLFVAFQVGRYRGDFPSFFSFLYKNLPF